MNTIETIQTIEHREFPLPHGPWVMMQIWHNLLFAHWPLKPEYLRSFLPARCTLDTFEGEAWIGIVPFWMSNVRPRGLPAVKPLSQFPELNVRTYVIEDGMPGVYFFSLEAGNPVAVALARRFFHLPYFNAQMKYTIEKDRVDYWSHRTHRRAPEADFIARYQPIQPVTLAQSGSIEHWLTERYYLYTVFQERLYRGPIHHVPWPLQVAEMELEQNTMTRPYGIQLPDTQPLLHYARRQEVLVWPLHKIH